MRKLWTILGVFAVILTVSLLSGCKESTNPVTAPGPGVTNAVNTIELRLQYNLVRGFKGEQREMTIIGIAKNAAGTGMQGQHVTLGITSPTSWKGTIRTADSLSNWNGEVTGTYSVVLAQAGKVTFEAKCGTVYQSASLNIEVVDEIIDVLYLESNRRVLTVQPNTERTATITATLIDTISSATGTEKRPISGLQIKFRIEDPTFGRLDSDTGVTDVNGQVRRIFTTYAADPARFGSTNIIAEVGDLVAKVPIDIRPVSSPARIQITPRDTTLYTVGNQRVMAPVVAVVTDSGGVAVPGVTVRFEMTPLVAGVDTLFGSLTPLDTTSALGEVLTSFDSRGGSGNLLVTATVLPSGLDSSPLTGAEDNSSGTGDLNGAHKGVKGDAKIFASEDIISAAMIIRVVEGRDSISFLTVRAMPSFLRLPLDTLGNAMILAQVRDGNKNGIPGLEIQYRTNLGTLSSPSMTDANGVSFCTFSNNYEFGVATITATIAGGGAGGMPVEKQCTINVTPRGVGQPKLSLSTDVPYIYADNGITTAMITAVLKDEEDMALVGEELTFASTFGTITPKMITDSIGTVKTYFTDLGSPSTDINGNIIPTVITCRYPKAQISAQVEVEIRLPELVDHIILSVGKMRMGAGSSDTTTVRATCYLTAAGTKLSPLGTLVSFSVEDNMGTFVPVNKPTDEGIAQVLFIAGNRVGIAKITAKVNNKTGAGEIILSSNVAEIELYAGPPASMAISATPNLLVLGQPDATSKINVTVTDSVGNPIKDNSALVTFTSTLGTCDPPAATTLGGSVTVTLRPGVESGSCKITATVDGVAGPIAVSTTVQFIAGGGSSIELTASPMLIQVKGAGGRQTSTIRATVRDANFNLVQLNTKVVFELINEPGAPEGCDLNGKGYRDTSTTANGVAVASMNSGTQTGSKLIKAYTLLENNRPSGVQATLSNVAVVAGPPEMVDIDVNDAGADAGGGSWAIEVSARVFDMYKNPVADSIPVVFGITQDNASVSPGFTGNKGLGGDPTPGLAYAILTYNSKVTYDKVTITAMCRTEMKDSVSGQRDHVLPLQEGTLELHNDPANWMFRKGATDSCDVRVWGVLKDGHGILINNAPILFTANRAKFFYESRNAPRQFKLFFPNVTRRLTGPANDPATGGADLQYDKDPMGHAVVWLRGHEYDFFLDPVTPEITVQIDARVEAYDDVKADPAFLFVTRR